MAPTSRRHDERTGPQEFPNADALLAAEFAVEISPQVSAGDCVVLPAFVARAQQRTEVNVGFGCGRHRVVNDQRRMLRPGVKRLLEPLERVVTVVEVAAMPVGKTSEAFQ